MVVAIVAAPLRVIHASYFSFTQEELQLRYMLRTLKKSISFSRYAIALAVGAVFFVLGMSSQADLGKLVSGDAVLDVIAEKAHADHDGGGDNGWWSGDGDGGDGGDGDGGDGG